MKIVVKCDDLYNDYLVVTRELHKLTDTEIKVFALYLKKFNGYRDKVTDTSVISRLLKGDKDDIRIECGLKAAQYNNILSSIRKKNVMDKDYNINQRLQFNPEIDNILTYEFKQKEDAHNSNNEEVNSKE